MDLFSNPVMRHLFFTYSCFFQDFAQDTLVVQSITVFFDGIISRVTELVKNIVQGWLQKYFNKSEDDCVERNDEENPANCHCDYANEDTSVTDGRVMPESARVNLEDKKENYAANQIWHKNKQELAEPVLPEVPLPTSAASLPSVSFGFPGSTAVSSPPSAVSAAVTNKNLKNLSQHIGFTFRIPDVKSAELSASSDTAVTSFRTLGSASSALFGSGPSTPVASPAFGARQPPAFGQSQGSSQPSFGSVSAALFSAGAQPAPPAFSSVTSSAHPSVFRRHTTQQPGFGSGTPTTRSVFQPGNNTCNFNFSINPRVLTGGADPPAPAAPPTATDPSGFSFRLPPARTEGSNGKNLFSASGSSFGGWKIKDS
ncbi:uncharacterized protein O3Q21_008072 [Podargus strigoides]